MFFQFIFNFKRIVRKRKKKSGRSAFIINLKNCRYVCMSLYGTLYKSTGLTKNKILLRWPKRARQRKLIFKIYNAAHKTIAHAGEFTKF